MTLPKILCAGCLAGVIALTPFTVAADAGHDHGPAAAVTGASAQPRFAAVSESFELVGALNGRLLTLFLDRADDNSPVKDARLELELGGVKMDIKARGDGEFETILEQPLKPGTTSVSATVVAGSETDLLVADLEIFADTRPAETRRSRQWEVYASWAVAGLLGLVLVGVGLRQVSAYRVKRTAEVA